jgi:hypothetical protein
LIGLAFTPSWTNVELNVTEAWQVISAPMSRTLSRYVRLVASGIGMPSRRHTRAVEATFHGELFALAQLSLEPAVDLPLTDVVTSLPFPVPTLESRDVPCSANHMAPLGPAAIPHGADPTNGTGL